MHHALVWSNWWRDLMDRSADFNLSLDLDFDVPSHITKQKTSPATTKNQIQTPTQTQTQTQTPKKGYPTTSKIPTSPSAYNPIIPPGHSHKVTSFDGIIHSVGILGPVPSKIPRPPFSPPPPTQSRTSVTSSEMDKGVKKAKSLVGSTPSASGNAKTKAVPESGSDQPHLHSTPVTTSSSNVIEKIHQVIEDDYEQELRALGRRTLNHLDNDYDDDDDDNYDPWGEGEDDDDDMGRKSCMPAMQYGSKSLLDLDALRVIREEAAAAEKQRGSYGEAYSNDGDDDYDDDDEGMGRQSTVSPGMLKGFHQRGSSANSVFSDASGENGKEDDDYNDDGDDDGPDMSKFLAVQEARRKQIEWEETQQQQQQQAEEERIKAETEKERERGNKLKQKSSLESRVDAQRQAQTTKGASGKTKTLSNSPYHPHPPPPPSSKPPPTSTSASASVFTSTPQSLSVATSQNIKSVVTNTQQYSQHHSQQHINRSRDGNEGKTHSPTGYSYNPSYDDVKGDESDNDEDYEASSTTSQGDLDDSDVFGLVNTNASLQRQHASTSASASTSTPTSAPVSTPTSSKFVSMFTQHQQQYFSPTSTSLGGQDMGNSLSLSMSLSHDDFDTTVAMQTSATPTFPPAATYFQQQQRQKSPRQQSTRASSPTSPVLSHFSSYPSPSQSRRSTGRHQTSSDEPAFPEDGGEEEEDEEDEERETYREKGRDSVYIDPESLRRFREGEGDFSDDDDDDNAAEKEDNEEVEDNYYSRRHPNTSSRKTGGSKNTTLSNTANMSNMSTTASPPRSILKNTTLTRMGVPFGGSDSETEGSSSGQGQSPRGKRKTARFARPPTQSFDKVASPSSKVTKSKGGKERTTATKNSGKAHGDGQRENQREEKDEKEKKDDDGKYGRDHSAVEQSWNPNVTPVRSHPPQHVYSGFEVSSRPHPTLFSSSMPGFGSPFLPTPVHIPGEAGLFSPFDFLAGTTGSNDNKSETQAKSQKEEGYESVPTFASFSPFSPSSHSFTSVSSTSSTSSPSPALLRALQSEVISLREEVFRLRASESAAASLAASSRTAADSAMATTTSLTSQVAAQDFAARDLLEKIDEAYAALHASRTSAAAREETAREAVARAISRAERAERASARTASTLEDMREKYVAAEKEATQALDALAATTSALTQVREAEARALAELERARRETLTVNGKIAEMELLLAAEVVEKERLRVALNARENEILIRVREVETKAEAAAKSRVTSLHAALDDAEQRAAEAIAGRTAAVAELDSLRRRITAERTRAEKAAREALGERESLENRVREVVEAHQDSQAKTREWEQQVRDGETALRLALREVDTLRNRVQEVEGDAENTAESLRGELTTIKRTAKKTIATAAAREQALLKENSSLSRALVIAREKADGQTRQWIHEAEQERRRADDSEVARASAEMRLAEVLRQSEESVAETQRRHARRVRLLREEIVAFSRQLEAVEDDLSRTRAECEEMKALAQAAEDEAVDARERVLREVEEKNTLYAQLSRYSDQLQAARREKEELEDSGRAAEVMAEGLKLHVQRLKKQLAKARLDAGSP